MPRGRQPAELPAAKVRMMRPPDVRQVVEIEVASSAVPWTRRMFMAELGRATSLDLVIVQAADVLGFAMVTRYADVWHILNLCVDGDHRGRGLGGLLLDELFRRADTYANLGYTLEVRVSNEQAIRLYRRKRFLDHGVRPGYYSDNGEDAMIMWRRGEPEDQRA